MVPGSEMSRGGGEGMFGVELPPGLPGSRTYVDEEVFGLGQAGYQVMSRAGLEEIATIAAFGGGSAVGFLAAASGATRAPEKTAYTILGIGLGAVAVFKVGKLFNIF